MIDHLLQSGLIPKYLYRLVINLQIRDRLRSEKKRFSDSAGQSNTKLIHKLAHSDIALSTDKANAQHYEVPTEFYRYILGPRLKYSCCDYTQAKTLADAETDMLTLYCQRADIHNGQQILDLGCGWGSLTLYAASQFPGSHITAVSNSVTQTQYIDQMAARKGLKNITTLTCDVNHLHLTGQYNRIVSIEMFEHVRNYAYLLKKIASWLSPTGYLFVHHFCHQHLIYPFNTNDSWMAKHFFTDGLMPSEDLLLFFNDDVVVDQRWRVNGRHYANTCYHWLANLYKHQQQIMAVFNLHYDCATLMYQYWDLFIRACAQLFAYHAGNEWFVTHYLFKKRK